MDGSTLKIIILLGPEDLGESHCTAIIPIGTVIHKTCNTQSPFCSHLYSNHVQSKPHITFFQSNALHLLPSESDIHHHYIIIILLFTTILYMLISNYTLTISLNIINFYYYINIYNLSS